MALLFLFLYGCEELGPEARGERQTTALQSIARERECLPYFDIQSVRWTDSQAVEFLLRDGTRWRNDTQAGCLNGSNQSRFAFDSSDKELCRGDTLLVLERRHQLYGHQRNCELGRFTVQ